ncbi:unnamed protein product, partial [Rangifer tarandus platyrhynchus]
MQKTAPRFPTCSTAIKIHPGSGEGSKRWGGPKGKRKKEKGGKKEGKREPATIKTSLFSLYSLGSFQEDNVFPPRIAPLPPSLFSQEANPGALSMCPSRQNNEALEASAPRFLQLSGAPAEPLLERGGEAAGAEGRGDRLWELGEGEPAGCCGAARGKPISQIIGLDPTVLPRLQAQSGGQRAHLHITISPEPGRVQLTDCGDNGQSSTECQPCTKCQALGALALDSPVAQ